MLLDMSEAVLVIVLISLEKITLKFEWLISKRLVIILLITHRLTCDSFYIETGMNNLNI